MAEIDIDILSDDEKREVEQKAHERQEDLDTPLEELIQQVRQLAAEKARQADTSQWNDAMPENPEPLKQIFSPDPDRPNSFYLTPGGDVVFGIGQENAPFESNVVGPDIARNLRDRLSDL